MLFNNMAWRKEYDGEIRVDFKLDARNLARREELKGRDNEATAFRGRPVFASRYLATLSIGWPRRALSTDWYGYQP